MVDTLSRGKGIVRVLYKEFSKTVKMLGRTVIRCATSPRNKNSISFHTRMGFVIEPQEQEFEGFPVCLDYDGRLRRSCNLYVIRGHYDSSSDSFLDERVC